MDIDQNSWKNKPIDKNSIILDVGLKNSKFLEFQILLTLIFITPDFLARNRKLDEFHIMFIVELALECKFVYLDE